MPLLNGQILQSRYRILRPLGQGGMGAVYLAEDLRLGSRCALKEQTPDPNASPQALSAGPPAVPGRGAHPRAPESPEPAQGVGLLFGGGQ